MSTILAYTSPAIGHLYPMVPLLLELKARGHQVNVRTLEDQTATIAGLGLGACAIDRRIAAIHHDDHSARGTSDALLRSSTVFARRGEYDSQDLMAAIEDSSPDLLVIDVNSWGAASVADSLGIPWVTFSPYIPALDSPGTPPFGPGLAPMGGPIGRLRDAIARKAVLGVVEKSLVSQLNPLRARLGASPVNSADDFFRRAPLLLITTAKPFEYESTSWGPRVKLIGACPWEPPRTAPAWLDQIDDPIVLVTSSSEFQDDSVLVETAFEALADEPVHVLATAPAGHATSVPVPSNATLVRFIPHGPVLERSVAAITHGGMGATQKALSHGVPVCVVPFGRDQFEVARRVAVAEAGVRLPRRKLSPKGLRSAVMSTIEMADGARRVADGYISAGGAAAGADAVESLLDGRVGGDSGAS